MSFIVKTEELLEALQQISKVVPGRSTLPILSCAHFNFNNKQVKIRATNLETSINISIDIEGEKPTNPIAIPVNRLLEITGSLKEAKIELDVSKEGTLKIKTENGLYSITGQDHQDFPADPIMKESISLNINTKNFLEIINFTKTSASRDELKPALQGVLLKIDNKRILGVSTDGHRLSRIVKESSTEQEKEFEIIAPIKFLTILTSFINKTENIEIEISSNYISLSYKNISLFSRIIKDTYPDYEKVIPLDNNKTLTIEKKELIEAIKRVSIFSNRTTKQITLNIEKNNIEITTEDAENAAAAKETINCNFDSNEKLKIGFNSSFILEALGNTTNPKTTMFLKESLSAAILVEKNEKTDKLILLMPIRLND